MKFESPVLRESYEKIVHKSGLEIYVFPKKMSTAFAALAARFGSIDRAFRAGDEKSFTTVPAGTAHYLEHKLFDNPEGVDPFARFSELGTDLNAYTSYTVTCYHFSTPEPLAPALEELFRLVLTPYFTKESVEKERGIITEEIRSGLDSPSDRCLQNAFAGLYHACPVREEIAGSIDSIKEITAETLYRCYQTFYQPSNMILSVCGNVTAEEVLAVVDKMLPEAPAAKTIFRAPIEEPETVKESRKTVRMPLAKPLFYLATKDPVLPADPMARLRRDAAFSLLSDTLFSKSTPFYSNLFEEGLLTPSYSAGYSGTDRFALHSVCGESPNLEAVADRVKKTLETAVQQGLDPADFERSRRCLVAEEIRSFDSTEEIGNDLLDCALEGVDLFSYLTLLEAVTAEECAALAKDLLLPGRSCLSVVLPKETETN